MNSMAQRACESDKTDKHHAEEIDDRMQQLRNTSSRLGLYPGVEEFDNTSVTTLCLSHSQNMNAVGYRGPAAACIERLMIVTY